MKRREIVLIRLKLALLSFGIIAASCSKDAPVPPIENNDPENPDPIENPIPDDEIVSGDPSLNDFLITTLNENIVKVNTETGQYENIAFFEDLIDPTALPDYKNGMVYMASDDNYLNAIDISGKNFLWYTPMLEYKHNSLDISDVVCHDDVCYASGTFGVIVALNQSNGEVLWHYSTDPDGELTSVLNSAKTPIVRGNNVYVFSEEGFNGAHPAYIHVLDKQTGQLKNKYELPYDLSGMPVFEQNTLYVPAKNLYALDAETFNVKWTFTNERIGTPSVLNGRVAVQGISFNESIYSELFCLDADSGELQWRVDTGFEDVIWSPIIVEDVVFGLFEYASPSQYSINGRPFAVRLSDGQQLWYRERVSVDHNPVYANGRLFFHGHDIDRSENTENNVGLFSMDANTGKILWLNTAFDSPNSLTPLVVGQNGVFGPSEYRGN